MSCSAYISSNANRLYAAREAGYGQVPAITAGNRFPAVKLTTRQQLDVADRKDKTGSRTFGGVPAGSRKRTSFQLRTYMTGWDQNGEPGYGPLFEASLGGSPLLFTGGVLAAGTTQSQLVFNAVHGLISGQAVTHGGELRFVDAVVNDSTAILNAPLSVTPMAGSPVGPTVTYMLQTQLPSVSVFDYWSPATSVQRILAGAAVDRLDIQINGDYHEFEFRGGAQDILDSVSFASGMGALSSFPAEPAPDVFDYTIIPGHLGQAWLGANPDRFYTITDATVRLENDIDFRAREFGSALARCLAPGRRSVSANFSLYEQDDEAHKALYQAARQQSPIAVMFQLGQQSGQLFGAYMRSVVPEVPDFDDSDRRLQWAFRDARAQGTIDDELVVAFG